MYKKLCKLNRKIIRDFNKGSKLTVQQFMLVEAVILISASTDNGYATLNEVVDFLKIEGSTATRNFYKLIKDKAIYVSEKVKNTRHYVVSKLGMEIYKTCAKDFEEKLTNLKLKLQNFDELDKQLDITLDEIFKD